VSEEFALGVWRQAPNQEGFDVEATIEIGKEECDEYRDAISWYRALSERNTYQVLQRNYARLTSMLATYTNLERVGGSFRAVDTRSVSIIFMGEMTNWLASTRLYLESERDFLLRQFGEESEEIRSFKAVCSRAFDTYPGYRFLYNLRDYTQHCGPPVSGMNVSRGSQSKRVVEMYLSRSELLIARFNWSRHAKTLLDSWPERISVMPLVDEAMNGFRLIEEEMLRILIRRCGMALSKMREGVARIQAEGHPSVFRLPPPGEGGQLSWQTFPELRGLDAIEEALRDNDPLSRLLRLPERPPVLSRGQRHANARAAAVIATWLEHGGGKEYADSVNQVIQADRGIVPLVSGLTNLCVTLIKMLGLALGSPPQQLLGSFIEQDEDEA
jgi:hypothetical protein